MGIFRAFLACVVAAGHWNVVVLRPKGLEFPQMAMLNFNPGYAVIFFYVISGFLISYTLNRNYKDDAHGRRGFYTNRFIRIFSLYWPVLILSFFAVPIFFDNFVKFSPLDIITSVTLLGADWNLVFSHYPHLNWDATPNGLHQVWTLGAELTFYVIAPFLVRRIPFLACVCVASLLIRAITGSLGFIGELHDAWTYHFIGSTMCFFLSGALIEWASRRFLILNSHLLGYVAITACVATMALTIDRNIFDGPRLWIPLFFFVVGLPGIFAATQNNRFMNYIGDLSYPIYLVHIIILVAAGATTFRITDRLVSASEPSYAVVSGLVFLAICVATSVVAHHILERPTAFLMHLAIKRWRKSALA